MTTAPPAPIHAVTSVEERYVELTPRSKIAFDEHMRLIPAGAPGGISQTLPFPHQPYIERGDGCYVWDADDRKLVDLVYGDWLYPLGHHHPAITAALHAQVDKGPTFCLPDPNLGTRFATLLLDRLPWMDKVRCTPSGTEATMIAMRMARVATGRPKIAKIIGGYHGLADPSLLVNGRYPNPYHVPAGLIPGTVESTVLLPYNDVAATVEVLQREGDDLAGVIVEPILGGSGMVPATPQYLRTLREVTRQLGMVLIFDEVVTFPYGPGGVQGALGIEPDLTTLGKAIGGGTPLGVIAGRRALMDLLDNRLNPSPGVRHASTVGGSPLCLAAGVAVLENLTPDVYRHLHDLGNALRLGVGTLAKKYHVPLQATGAGHFFSFHWTQTPVTDFASAITTDKATVGRLILSLYNEGFVMMSAQAGTLSTPMTRAHIDDLLSALERSLFACGLVQA
ncbi:glutamate-1-semialdehyde 2,1-aminomutase [Phytohabitans suffuscus]|uniref:Glutamate-1-semialdehyde 2,1-aminomutase n=1 Tax=Phytohabitans suffuscus TaxID=624315 RepID=A0A6F8YR41_9ACTN|nr:glutamate-1-semialdehyde 2,1-aminomutase [Phytohabitans suffuscus]